MIPTRLTHASLGALLTLALALPGVALAYGNHDAIRDCESRLRSEYHLSDLRDASAEKLGDSEHHYKVHGLAKVDGDKHPWTCEVKNRHVTSAEYSGPKPKGMGTAEKLAIGAGAAIAAGVAVNAMSKSGDGSHATQGHSGSDEHAINEMSNGQFEVVWPNRDCIATFNQKAEAMRFSPGCNDDLNARSYDIARHHVGSGHTQASHAQGHSAEYKRGYNDAMKGHAFDQNRHPQDYKDGYRAGEEAR
jgi:hypothetical protein